MNSSMSTSDYSKQIILERPNDTNKERTIQAIGRVGQAVNVAVERFMSIGEIIAEDNAEIKADMLGSCKDAIDAGKSIEQLCEISAIHDIDSPVLIEPLFDRSAIVLACRSLFSSITRVLLLVDIVIVRQLLTAKKKFSKSLKKIESILNFTDFVRAFAAFGVEMVELSYLIGNRQSGCKEERRRAQMHSARIILERSITILLTSSKTSLVHCDCMLAKENRDTVFCQIRRAMDLIHFVVKDNFFDTPWLSSIDQIDCYRNAEKGTIYSSFKVLIHLIDCLRRQLTKQDKTICMGNSECPKILDTVTMENSWSSEIKNHHLSFIHHKTEEEILSDSNYMQESKTRPIWQGMEKLQMPTAHAETREQLLFAFDKLLEKIHDFTDSAYTSHENREKILALCNRCKIELNKYLKNKIRNEHYSATQEVNDGIENVLTVVKNLSEQLVLSVADQAVDLYYSLKMSVELVNNFHTLAIKQDLSRLQEYSNRFHDYCDHIIDVCKLLRHIAITETLQVQAKYLAINLRIYGPQILTAAKILTKYSTSTSAMENFEAFVDMWKWLASEITLMSKQILQAKSDSNGTAFEYINVQEKYEVSNSQKSYPLAQEEHEKDSYTDAGLDNKGVSSNRNTAVDKWNDELTDNDILKRAKNMSAMAFSMYQFTKGNGTLRTTQDLFTQAEYFAEEANRLYKVLRQFSYQVPASQNKKDLLKILDRVPTFVQTLQFTVKDHTVGKAATFVKVDHVIRETKNLMNVINKVVNSCFECATKYKLDFSGLSGGITSGSLRGEDNSAGGMGDSKGTSNSTEGSM